MNVTKDTSINHLVNKMKQNLITMIEYSKLADLCYILSNTLSTQPHDSKEYLGAVDDMVKLFDVTAEEAVSTNGSVLMHRLVRQYTANIYTNVLLLKLFIPMVVEDNKAVIKDIDALVERMTPQQEDQTFITEEQAIQAAAIGEEVFVSKDIKFYNYSWFKDYIDTVKNGIVIKNILLQAATGCKESADSDVSFESYNEKFDTLDSTITSFVLTSVKPASEMKSIKELGWTSKSLREVKDELVDITKAFESFVNTTHSVDVFNIVNIVERAYGQVYDPERPLPSRYMNTALNSINNILTVSANIPSEYRDVLLAIKG